MNPKSILIPRIVKDKIKTKNYFNKLGYNNIIIYPIFDAKEIEVNIGNNYDIIAITSMNAISALSKNNISINQKIFTVGLKSASLIKKEGYKNVIYAKNSAESLLKLIINHITFPTDQIIYLSGENITLDIAEKLKQKGFLAERKIVYKIIPKKELSKEIIENLKNNTITAISFYSKNTINIFLDLCKKHHCEHIIKYLTTFCFSKKISRYCIEMGFTKKESYILK